MAKDQSGKKVKMGRIGDLKIVANQNAKPAASKQYYALRVQLPSGEEVSALFTESQVAAAILRAKKNPEDVPVAGDLFGKIRDALD